MALRKNIRFVIIVEAFKAYLKKSHFIHGMVRVIDIGCSSFSRKCGQQDNTISVWESIGQDWHNVGNDIRSAIEKYRHETKDTK